MKLMFVQLLVSFFTLSSLAQVGHVFPTLHAQRLDEHKVVLPDDAKGKYTLLGLAYSKEAEADLATWYQPVYETFIHKDKGGVFETESYDIHLFLVPMFTGVNQAAHGKAVKTMQTSVDKTLWPHLLIYKGEIKDYKTQLQMENKELPHLFVLDKKGKIVYKTTGKYSDSKMEEIEKHISSH